MRIKFEIFILVTIFLLIFIIIFAFQKNFDFFDKKREVENYNVILITIDALRADHLSSYGYYRNTSPNIDKFAKEGVLFKNVIIQKPHTIPSHASILTGLYPLTHKSIDPFSPLNESFVTLPEISKQYNFETIGVVNANFFDDLNLNQGFDKFLVVEDENNARLVTDFAIDTLNKTKNKFFLWLHYFQLHALYNPPAPYDKIFAVENYTGKIRGNESDLTTFHYVENITIEEIEHVVAMYDGDIKFVDDQIKRLLDFLEEKGLRDNTIIVITSDHGEQLGEKSNNVSLFGHHLTLFLQEIRVPLIIKGPNIPVGHIFEEPVESVDILPTILGLLNVLIDENIEGKNLLPYLYDGKNNYTFLAFSNLWLPTPINITFDVDKLLSLSKYNESSVERRYSLDIYKIRKEHIDKFLKFLNLHSEFSINYRDNISIYICDREYYIIKITAYSKLNNTENAEIDKIFYSISCDKKNFSDLSDDHLVFTHKNFSIIYPKTMKKYPYFPHINSMISKRYQLIETNYGKYEIYDIFNNYSIVSDQKIREDLIKKFLDESNYKKRFKPEDYFILMKKNNFYLKEEIIEKLRSLGYMTS